MKHDLILISLQWPEGTWWARLDLLHGLPSLLSDLKSEGDNLWHSTNAPWTCPTATRRPIE